VVSETDFNGGETFVIRKVVFMLKQGGEVAIDKEEY
jgi:hypothetical protein